MSVVHTIGAIVRGDLWGRFFDFRPRWGVARPSLSLSPSLRASSTLVAESGGDTAKLSEGSGLKVDRQFIRRGRRRRGCGLILLRFEVFCFGFLSRVAACADFLGIESGLFSRFRGDEFRLVIRYWGVDRLSVVFGG